MDVGKEEDGVNPFRAPKSLPILTSSKIVPIRVSGCKGAKMGSTPPVWRPLRKGRSDAMLDSMISCKLLGKPNGCCMLCSASVVVVARWESAGCCAICAIVIFFV